MKQASIKAAVKSPVSWLLLAYGAVALFNLVRGMFDIPAIDPVKLIVERYRLSLDTAVDWTLGWTGLSLPPLAQDALVLWLAVGRAFSRTYVLLEEEIRSPKFHYPPFERQPLLALQRLARWLGRYSNGRLYRVGVAIGSFAVCLAWPLAAWLFLRERTVLKVERWREYTGGTPHPSNPRMIELPPIGDELKPKFSKENVSRTDHYDAAVIVTTYLIVQLALTGMLLGGNALLLASLK